MPTTSKTANTAEQRVLVLAPLGRDAALICDVLSKHGLECAVCSGLDDLIAELSAGVGALFLTEEVLRHPAIHQLTHALEAQPKWSDVPCIFLTARAHENNGNHTQIHHRLASANITVLERPTRSVTIATAARSALRARQRQYEIRDFLAERHRIEETLRRTQKLESIGVLAGGIAHDFNNLLTGILGNASLALSTLERDRCEYAQMDQVVKAAERAADLTKQLLAYSGKGAFVVGPVDLTALVSETRQLTQLMIPKHVNLHVNLQDGLPLVNADASQLQQVIMNLVINAAEAIAPDRTGSVTVTTGVKDMSERDLERVFIGDDLTPGPYVVLEVRDNSVGIPEDTRAKMFDPFFTTKFLGRGLGLAAVQGIVRGHKGGLNLESVLGRGTTFQVLLPATQLERMQSKAPPVTRLAYGSGTILVVDDEAAVRTFEKGTLERLGYKVLLANDGQEAVDTILLEKDIALVLLDATMPVMSGKEACPKIKSIRPELPIVLCSGYTESQAVAPFEKGDLAGFLQKPCTALQLAEKVSAILRKRR